MATCPNCGSDQVQECPDCGGSGSAGQSSCQTCNGSGLVDAATGGAHSCHS